MATVVQQVNALAKSTPTDPVAAGVALRLGDEELDFVILVRNTITIP